MSEIESNEGHIPVFSELSEEEVAELRLLDRSRATNLMRRQEGDNLEAVKVPVVSTKECDK